MQTLGEHFMVVMVDELLHSIRNLFGEMFSCFLFRDDREDITLCYVQL